MESSTDPNPQPDAASASADSDEKTADSHCPVCGAALHHEKCKVVCRSPKCTYRIIFNCAEF